MIDYHLHTTRCCHATGSLEDYLAVAEKKQLREIGFSDHFPLDLLGVTPRAPVTMEASELEEYIKEVEGLKSLGLNMNIKLGIEIDYIPGTENKLGRLLEQYDFDYVIGSIHYLGDWDFTHPVYADHYKDYDMDSLYEKYFKLIQDACRSRLFDVIGHIDVIKKFGYRPADDLEAIYIETARLLRESGTCIEVNTARQDAPIREFYPDPHLLKICLSEGVAVTMGSDAHSPEQVGRYFNEAIELLKLSGCRELTVFNRRKRSSIQL